MKEYNILVVEDDKETSRFYNLFLKKDFNLFFIDSSDDFYSILETEDIHLIIMDISIFGNKNGLELTKEIKSNDKYKNIPVLCITAHAFKHDENNAINAGVDHFIRKPFNIHKLKELINESITQSQTH